MATQSPLGGMLKRASMTPNLLWYIKGLRSTGLKPVDLTQTLPGFRNDLKTLVRQGRLFIPIFDLSFVLSPRNAEF